VAPNGGVYFSDPMYPRTWWKRDPKIQVGGEFVYYLSPDRKTLRPVATDLKKPNGVIGSPDGKTLYVADIGASKTYVYEIKDDGTLACKKLFCELGSDGMTLDSEGNVYLTGKGVIVFDKTGQKIQQIDVPEKWTGNVCFGGKEHDTLFITASLGLYSIKTRVRGAGSQ
jgi:gluconolactonase